MAFGLLLGVSVFYRKMTALFPRHGAWHGMDLGVLSENPAQNEARTLQRAGETVSSLLLSPAGPAALHRTFKQVPPPTHTDIYTQCAFLSFSIVLQHIYFHRYIHIIMVFWSFLAGVVTFYCSLGPESLLPNIFVSIKPKPKVGAVQLNAFVTMAIYLKAQGDLFPLPCSHTSRSYFHWATAVPSVERSSAKDTGETPAHLSLSSAAGSPSIVGASGKMSTFPTYLQKGNIVQYKWITG